MVCVCTAPCCGFEENHWFYYNGIAYQIESYPETESKVKSYSDMSTYNSNGGIQI